MRLWMETLAYGYGLVEAPRVDEQDRLYFSDVINGGVYRRSPDGTIETIVPKRRGVGGMVLHADGGVVVSGKNVAHVKDGLTRVLLEVEGALGFNDLTTDAAGRVYVGSLRSNAFDEGPRVPGECWRIEGEGRGVEVYKPVEFANGIGFSPDGKTLYHASYSEAHVLAVDIAEDGTASNRRVFARMPRGNPDGIAVDETGAVWVALGRGGAVARFAPNGELASILEVPSPFVTSLCFGGKDRRDVYIVTLENGEMPERKGTIFRTRSDVPGLVAPLARV